jgi:hypothetical protein
MKDTRAWEMTIRFVFEEELHDDIEKDHSTQCFASDRRQLVQVEMAHSSGMMGDTATRHRRCSIADIASLARTGILVVRRLQSLLERGYLVDRYCRIRHTVLGWEPNARLVHIGRWIQLSG